MHCTYIHIYNIYIYIQVYILHSTSTHVPVPLLHRYTKQISLYHPIHLLSCYSSLYRFPLLYHSVHFRSTFNSVFVFESWCMRACFRTYSIFLRRCEGGSFHAASNYIIRNRIKNQARPSRWVHSNYKIGRAHV